MSLYRAQLFENFCSLRKIKFKHVPTSRILAYAVLKDSKPTLEENGYKVLTKNDSCFVILETSSAVSTGQIADRVGVFTIQGENPGLMPSLRKEHGKKNRSKVEYSFLANDKDAKTDHIKGEMGNNGLPKKKISEMLDDKILRVMLESTTIPNQYFDKVLHGIHRSVKNDQIVSSELLCNLKPFINVDSNDETIRVYSEHISDILEGFGAQSINSDNVDKNDFNYIYDYAKRRSTNPNEYTGKYLNRDQLKIKLDTSRSA